MKLAESNHQHLERQLATAHLLRGAINMADAATARVESKADRLATNSALHHFKSALAVDKNDCEALEYAAHAHVCLKQDEDAEQMLDRLLHITVE